MLKINIISKCVYKYLTFFVIPLFIHLFLFLFTGLQNFLVTDIGNCNLLEKREAFVVSVTKNCPRLFEF